MDPDFEPDDEFTPDPDFEPEPGAFAAVVGDQPRRLPSKFEAAQKPPAPAAPSSLLDAPKSGFAATLRAALSGLMGGFSDELVGNQMVIENLYPDAKAPVSYHQARDDYRKLEAEDHAAHPYKTGVANLAGGAVTALMTPVKAPILGAIYGLGGSEAELTPDRITPTEVAKAAGSTALGAGVAALGAKAPVRTGVALAGANEFLNRNNPEDRNLGRAGAAMMMLGGAAANRGRSQAAKAQQLLKPVREEAQKAANKAQGLAQQEVRIENKQAAKERANYEVKKLRQAIARLAKNEKDTSPAALERAIAKAEGKVSKAEKSRQGLHGREAQRDLAAVSEFLGPVEELAAKGHEGAKKVIAEPEIQRLKARFPELGAERLQEIAQNPAAVRAEKITQSRLEAAARELAAARARAAQGPVSPAEFIEKVRATPDVPKADAQALRDLIIARETAAGVAPPNVRRFSPEEVVAEGSKRLTPEWLQSRNPSLAERYLGASPTDEVLAERLPKTTDRLQDHAISPEAQAALSSRPISARVLDYLKTKTRAAPYERYQSAAKSRDTWTPVGEVTEPWRKAASLNFAGLKDEDRRRLVEWLRAQGTK